MTETTFILRKPAYKALIGRARRITENLDHRIGLFSRKPLTDRWVAKCRKCNSEVTIILTPVVDERQITGKAIWERCG